jgi:phosphoglucosamine mutase
MPRLFGTDGVRGVANQEPMTPETVVKLGRAAAHLFKTPGARRSIVIGKDTRLTGYMLETALTAGITSMGVDVILVGPLPTPGIAFITRSLRADAGVVISASHNSFEDNGIKFFSGDGLKLPDAMEAEMENVITTGAID